LLCGKLISLVVNYGGKQKENQAFFLSLGDLREETEMAGKSRATEEAAVSDVMLGER